MSIGWQVNFYIIYLCSVLETRPPSAAVWSKQWQDKPVTISCTRTKLSGTVLIVLIAFFSFFFSFYLFCLSFLFLNHIFQKLCWLELSLLFILWHLLFTGALLYCLASLVEGDLVALLFLYLPFLSVTNHTTCGIFFLFRLLSDWLSYTHIVCYRVVIDFTPFFTLPPLYPYQVFTPSTPIIIIHCLSFF